MGLRNSLSLIGAVTALSLASVAAAEEPVPPGKERRDARSEKRAEKKQERAERKEEHAEKKEQRAERRDDRRDASAEEKEKWRAERKERRDKRRDEFRQRWGGLLDDASARAELKVHARRMARLRAIKRLAEAEGKKAVAARADKLIEKEQARHQRRMENLKTKPPGAPAPTAANAAATAPTATGGAK